MHSKALSSCLSSQLFFDPYHQTALHFGALPSAAHPRKSFHKHVSIPASHLSQEIVPVCRNAGNCPQLHLLATSDEMASCALISRASPPSGAPAAAGQLELGLAEEPC